MLDPKINENPVASKNITSISKNQTLAICKQQTLSTKLSEQEVLTLAVKINPLLDSKQQVITVSGFGDNRDHEFIALEVAQALANSAPDRRILLIDVAFDEPALHNKADMPCSPGLSELLANKCSIGEVQAHSSAAGLYILPAGNRQEGVAPASLVGRFNTLVNQLKESFPTILFAIPNITQSTESELALTLSDAAIIVAKEGQTSKHDLLDAKTRLEQSDTKLFGVMLSKQVD